MIINHPQRLFNSAAMNNFTNKLKERNGHRLLLLNRVWLAVIYEVVLIQPYNAPACCLHDWYDNNMRTMIATLGQIIEMGDFKGVLISCQNVISRRDFFSTVESKTTITGRDRNEK